MAFNPTNSTWGQVANKQAANTMTYSNLNSKTLITQYDPIYNKLVEQISYTMYRKLRYTQNWVNLGATAPTNEYPGQLREIVMASRKGMNFPADNGTRPTSLNSYAIFDDTIDVRYHSAQFRWMYPWTIYDEELRRFSGGNGTTIAELAEMKMINAINARNMFMDNLRKQTLIEAMTNVGTEVSFSTDITDFSKLTTEQAKAFLNQLDNILFEMSIGTSAYNKGGYYQQTAKSDLQMIIPREWYYNVIRKAFPDTFNTQYFENILPENLILIDTFANTLNRGETEVVAPTYDANGMSLLNYKSGDTFTAPNSDWLCCIMHRDTIGFEDNLNETLFGQKDIEKLATPVRSHFWTKAYVTDLLNCVVITK
jgi:hypothetical protein